MDIGALNSKGKGKSKNKKGQGKSGSSGKSGGTKAAKTCYHCGKTGHIKADCWQFQQKDGKGSGGGKPSSDKGGKGHNPKGKGGKSKGKGKKGMNNVEQDTTHEPEEEDWDAEEWTEDLATNGLTLYGLDRGDGRGNGGSEYVEWDDSLSDSSEWTCEPNPSVESHRDAVVAPLPTATEETGTVPVRLQPVRPEDGRGSVPKSTVVTKTPPGPPPGWRPKSPEGPPPGWQPEGPKPPPPKAASAPNATASTTGSAFVQLVKSALAGQLLSETADLEGRDQIKAREAIRALAKRSAKAPPITKANINDGSFHDSRYHRAVAAGTPHHVAWREERQRRRAIVNRREGMAARAEERIRLDKEWHRRFDNPESRKGPQRIDDGDMMDANIETEVMGKAEKTTSVTELGKKERLSRRQFPMDERKVLESSTKMKRTKRERPEEYKKRKNQKRNQARKNKRKAMAAGTNQGHEQDEDEEDDYNPPGAPDKHRDRAGGHDGEGKGGSAVAVHSFGGDAAGLRASWHGMKYIELNIDTAPPLRPFRLKQQPDIHALKGTACPTEPPMASRFWTRAV